MSTHPRSLWWLVSAVALSSCSVIKPDGALATLAGAPPPKIKTYADRNHIAPTLPQGQLRWKVAF